MPWKFINIWFQRFIDLPKNLQIPLSQHRFTKRHKLSLNSTCLHHHYVNANTQIHDPTHQQLSITPLILKTHITKQTIHKFSRERREKLTTDPDRCVELEEIGLREEDLARVDAQLTDLTFWQLNLFPSFTLQQSPYYILQNSLVHHPLHRHHIHFFLLKIQFFPKSHHTLKAKSS